jgi:hypothetical protein
VSRTYQILAPENGRRGGTFCEQLQVGVNGLTDMEVSEFARGFLRPRPPGAAGSAFSTPVVSKDLSAPHNGPVSTKQCINVVQPATIAHCQCTMHTCTVLRPSVHPSVRQDAVTLPRLTICFRHPSRAARRRRSITETNRIHTFLFSMQHRTFGSLFGSH